MKKTLTHLPVRAKAGKHNKAIRQLFKAETDEEQKLFDLLDYAYIGARYDARYRIEREELEWLSEKVQALLQMTDEMCREKIGSFGKQNCMETNVLSQQSVLFCAAKSAPITHRRPGADRTTADKSDWKQGRGRSTGVGFKV